MTSLTELKKLAENATPGPWDYYLEQGHEGCGVVVTYTEDENGMRTLKDSVFKRLVTSEENKEYLAAFNPSLALKLIEALEIQREALEQYANADSDPDGALAPKREGG